MLRYILKRLGFLVLTVLVTSIIIFTISQLLPGDIARVILGREVGEEALQAFRQKHGLDQPAVMQYLDWLTGFFTGDWGQSYSSDSAVRPLVLQRLSNSLMLGGVTLVISIPLAIILGVTAAVFKDSWLDNLISVSTLSVVGLPEFVTGLILIQIFAFGLNLLPANSSIGPDIGFREALPMLILPAMTATLVLLAYVARLTRSEVIKELDKDYVRTAELKGLPYRTVIFKHVLRNSLLPTITVIAISIGWLISGLVVVENVFNFPGLGRLLVYAIGRRDIPLIQATTFITVLGFAGANLVADVMYAVLDPQIRFQE